MRERERERLDFQTSFNTKFLNLHTTSSAQSLYKYLKVINSKELIKITSKKT